MKLCLVLFASLLFSLNSFASISVGDEVVYALRTGSTFHTLSRVVTAVDESKGTYTYNETDTMDDRVPGKPYQTTITEKIPSDESLGKLAADSIENCEKFAASRHPNHWSFILETVKVGEQTVSTCRIGVSPEKNVWYGNVPFGLVKRELRDADLETGITARVVNFKQQ